MTSGLCETGRGGCATARRPLAVVTAVGPILAGGRAEIQARRREIKPVARIRVPGICVPGFASPDSLPRARAKGARRAEVPVAGAGPAAARLRGLCGAAPEAAVLCGVSPRFGRR